VLSEITPAGVNAIFESFRTILHEGEIDKKVQYTIENLFAVRKTKFAAHPGVIPELDLVEEEDKITHTISLDDHCDGMDACNVFTFDPNYEQTEAEWDDIKKEILGLEEAGRLVKGPGVVGGGEDGGEDSSDLDQPSDINNNDKVSNRIAQKHPLLDH
jgi:pre-mRNA-splicing factor CWC22